MPARLARVLCSIFRAPLSLRLRVPLAKWEPPLSCGLEASPKWGWPDPRRKGRKRRRPVIVDRFAAHCARECVPAACRCHLAITRSALEESGLEESVRICLWVLLGQSAGVAGMGRNFLSVACRSVC